MALLNDYLTRKHNLCVKPTHMSSPFLVFYTSFKIRCLQISLPDISAYHDSSYLWTSQAFVCCLCYPRIISS